MNEKALDKYMLDKQVLAVCVACSYAQAEVTKLITLRALKNKWANCPKCKKPMRITDGSDTTFPTTY